MDGDDYYDIDDTYYLDSPRSYRTQYKGPLRLEYDDTTLNQEGMLRVCSRYPVGKTLPRSFADISKAASQLGMPLTTRLGAVPEYVLAPGIQFPLESPWRGLHDLLNDLISVIRKCSLRVGSLTDPSPFPDGHTITLSEATSWDSPIGRLAAYTEHAITRPVSLSAVQEPECPKASASDAREREVAAYQKAVFIFLWGLALQGGVQLLNYPKAKRTRKHGPGIAIGYAPRVHLQDDGVRLLLGPQGERTLIITFPVYRAVFPTEESFSERMEDRR